VDGVTAAADGSKKDQPLTLIPFADAKSYRVWLAKAESLPAEPVNVAAFGKESSSRRGVADGSICDLRADTFRNTAKAKPATEDWYAVEFNRPEKISRVVYRHGKSTSDGGWFAGKPQIQVRRHVSGKWETVAELDSYVGGPSLQDGQAFVVRLSEPVEAYAVRILGTPGKDYTSCAELEAYSQ
jgi:hypothetical protein